MVRPNSWYIRLMSYAAKQTSSCPQLHSCRLMTPAAGTRGAGPRSLLVCIQRCTHAAGPTARRRSSRLRSCVPYCVARSVAWAVVQLIARPVTRLVVQPIFDHCNSVGPMHLSWPVVCPDRLSMLLILNMAQHPFWRASRGPRSSSTGDHCTYLYFHTDSFGASSM